MNFVSRKAVVIRGKLLAVIFGGEQKGNIIAYHS
jgi:hypothetical protein